MAPRASAADITIGPGLLPVSSDADVGPSGDGVIFNGGTLRFGTSFNLSTGRALSLDSAGGTIDTNGFDTTFARDITGVGGLNKTGAGTLTLSGMNTYTGATSVAAGGILALTGQGRINQSSGITVDGIFDVSGAASAQVKALNGSGEVQLGTASLMVNNASGIFSGAIRGTGGISINGGTQILTGASDFSGGAGIASGATLQIGNNGNAGSITSDVTNYGSLIFKRSDDVTYAGSISGPGTFSHLGSSKLTLTATNSTRGDVFIGVGSTLQLGNGGTTGWIGGTGNFVGSISNAGALIVNRSNTVSYRGVISGSGTLTQMGSGTLTLAGTNTYTGATLVTGGTLVVNGSIASSSSVTVSPGATLSGSGQIPAMIVNGTLAPGNSPGTLTVNGSLTLAAGSSYLAEVQGAVSDRVNVTGAAALAGTLRIVPLGGAYTFSSPYTLLSAAGGLGGSRFGTEATSGTFGDGVTTAISYTSNDVLLTLTPKPLVPIVTPPAAPPGGLSPRMFGARMFSGFSIASAIDRVVAAGGDPSPLFTIYNLPAAEIPAAVNQLSGEAHTSVPAMANAAADQFLHAMLNPASAGRSGAGPGAATFSALGGKGSDEPARPAFLDAPAYSVWGAVLGSVGRNDGGARDGSAKRDVDDVHLAVGADLRVGPGSTVGFAVAGGSARASLSGGLGKADADIFQAGIYGMTKLGPVNLAAALAYARLENDVNRAVPALGASSLSSSYGSNAWSGRLQASAALFEWSGVTLSPVAALQAIQVRSPALTEASWNGANAAALNLARRSDVTSRSELGMQLDVGGAVNGLPVAGYLRAGWAHYYQREAGLSATISGLAGSGFAIDGARAPRNSALLAAGLDLKITPAVTLGARFDGELAASANRLGGQALVKVSF